MKRILLFVWLVFSWRVSPAQYLGQQGQVNFAAPFLLIPPDAPAGGMGDCGVATTPDAFSGHWNPAKPDFSNHKFWFGIGYTPWLRAIIPDFNMAYLSGYYKTGRNGTIGSSLRYMSYGNIAGQFRPNDIAGDLSFARKVSSHFSLGGAFRFIYSNSFINSPGYAFCADLGIFRLSSDTIITTIVEKSWGFCFSSLGGKMRYSSGGSAYFLPANTRFGGRISIRDVKGNSIGVMADLNKLMVPLSPSGNFFTALADAPGGFQEELSEITYGTGIEIKFRNMFSTRGGFAFNLSAGSSEYFTLGTGIRYLVFQLDFCYLIPVSVSNPLQNTLRFSFAFNFGSTQSHTNRNEDYY